MEAIHDRIVSGAEVRNRLKTKTKRSFCQDRLGTDIFKTKHTQIYKEEHATVSGLFIHAGARGAGERADGRAPQSGPAGARAGKKPHIVHHLHILKKHDHFAKTGSGHT